MFEIWSFPGAWCLASCVSLRRSSKIEMRRLPDPINLTAQLRLSRKHATADGERGRLDRCRRRPADARAAITLAHHLVSGICRAICSARRRTERPGRSRSPFSTAWFRLSEAETEARRKGGRPRSHEPTTPGCTAPQFAPGGSILDRMRGVGSRGDVIEKKPTVKPCGGAASKRSGAS